MQKLISVPDHLEPILTELAEELGLPFSRLFVFLAKDYIRNHPEIKLAGQKSETQERCDYFGGMALLRNENGIQE